MKIPLNVVFIVDLFLDPSLCETYFHKQDLVLLNFFPYIITFYQPKMELHTSCVTGSNTN